jgi:hypothetical protein
MIEGGEVVKHAVTANPVFVGSNPTPLAFHVTRRMVIYCVFISARNARPRKDRRK